MRKVLSEKEITLAEALELLKVEEESLDPLQRRTLEYLSKFSKIDGDVANRIVERLTQETSLLRREAIMIVNIMPSDPIEITSLFSSSKRYISKEEAEKVLSIIKEETSRGK
ncbi:hypothetical protein B6U74_02410 [Candidatus Bathyarchaeota archaeon ex4484_205]|nr:MAG: hypothetical protein B6U74_02410 [Candidatus Bathyarchaeota archaeon ex4484_205]HDN17718.1 hypothetical protein [Candidatus Bathyarchaeota archaeon]